MAHWFCSVFLTIFFGWRLQTCLRRIGAAIWRVLMARRTDSTYDLPWRSKEFQQQPWETNHTLNDLWVGCRLCGTHPPCPWLHWMAHWFCSVFLTILFGWRLQTCLRRIGAAIWRVLMARHTDSTYDLPWRSKEFQQEPWETNHIYIYICIYML